MKKTLTAWLLAFALALSCFATVPYALYPDIGSAAANTSTTKSNFSPVWEYWSQGGSVNYVLRRWGCHAVAHTKLLVECGAASADVTEFNPDIYFEWGVENGYYNRSNMLEQWGVYGPASDVIVYANANGVKLKKAGTVSLSGANSKADGDKVMQYINAGYYVIVTCKAHQAYVGREASQTAGRPILLDSWGSKSYYDGTCVEFVGYNLASFVELMYFSLEGEPVESIVPADTADESGEEIEEETEDTVEEPFAEENPEAPDAAERPPVTGDPEDNVEIGDTPVPKGKDPVELTSDEADEMESREEIELPGEPALLMLTADRAEYCLNGEWKMIEGCEGCAPVLVDGNLCVPVRAFAKAIGAQVSWDENAYQVDINGNGTAFSAWMGRTMVYINCAEKGMPVGLFQNEKGVTYIPLRFMCDQFSLSCDWDPDTHITYVNRK